MKGGAVRLERSPLKEAMDCETMAHGGTCQLSVAGLCIRARRAEVCKAKASFVLGCFVYLEKRSPAAARGLRVWLRGFGHDVVVYVVGTKVSQGQRQTVRGKLEWRKQKRQTGACLKLVCFGDGGRTGWTTGRVGWLDRKRKRWGGWVWIEEVAQDG